jgi:hypothetical protein
MIPADITSGLASLAAAVQAAYPLAATSNLTLAALQQQGQALLTTIETDLAAAAGALDGPDLSGLGPQLVTGLSALIAASANQTDIANAYGYVGRAVTNLGIAGY